jgi:hypothetical protein
MSQEPSPVDWPNRGRPPQEPDGLLRAFFRAEMPDPWPGFRRPPGPAPVVTTNGTAPGRARPPEGARPRILAGPRPALRSRLALGAVAALLLLGTLVLSGRFHNNTPDGPVGRGVANPDVPKNLILPPDMIIKESLIQEGEQPTKYQINIYAP